MNIQNLCFGGGGVRGISYIGVIKYLEETNLAKNILLCSGTSVGAIFSLFFICGYTSLEMTNIILKIKSNLLEDVQISSLINDFSIDTGVKMDKFIGKIITSKGYPENITFKELYQKTGKRLDICATRLNDYSRIIFNHVLTPEKEVRTACRYSVNIPFMWAKCVDTDDNNNVYIDGCFSSNIPIEHLPVDNTIGINCSNTYVKRKDIVGISDYLTAVVMCSRNTTNKLEIEKYKSNGYSIIQVQIENINTLDFTINEHTKIRMINAGYDSLKKFFC